MNTDEFRTRLLADGYSEPETVTREGGLSTTEHTHEFSAMALVLAGEVSVVTADGTTTCRTGDTFSLASGIPHCERYGPDGASFLLGRRVP